MATAVGAVILLTWLKFADVHELLWKAFAEMGWPCAPGSWAKRWWSDGLEVSIHAAWGMIRKVGMECPSRLQHEVISERSVEAGLGMPDKMRGH